MGVTSKAHHTRQPRYAARKPTVDELLASGNRLNRASADFLKIDVTTALTFSGIARQARDPGKKARNRHHARQAYDTVMRLIDRVTLSHEDIMILGRDLQRLRAELEMLGEEL